MSLPWTAVPYDFSIHNRLLDSSIAQEAAIQFPSIRDVILPRVNPDPTTHINLQEYLQSQGLQQVPTQLFGVDFSDFPPRGVHLQTTYSWMYMPLILQAANQGAPVIDIRIPQQHAAMWGRWLQMLSAHQDFLPLEQVFSLFHQLFHLSALHRNVIINDASPLLGQEIQEFIGSLNIAHNRQTQLWQNFNDAASEEHRAEVVALIEARDSERAL